MSECPECGSELELSESVETGEIVDCGTCGAELEVTGEDPVTLDLAPELDEDWGE
ncbi:lysine biosynthesis protein LysW [Halarchaeum nitratireducens]|uniref:Lysine biosynthesis protein LysW n=1 Tax=Halarchaeum nitratireducens TaxID=489913 RepID=A0A830G9A5_9EURY|nr:MULTISPECIES: lysine biosynthesis protein LysW [Halarchaeum]MBP2250408.1 alpha-aminoadipate carrier protein LysW [Halarchaeum solikamskense]GGN13295.1 lysine biosynthesis protein LysW [Halarchaeum nitratireducens]